MAKKSLRFIKLLPIIRAYQTEGYTYLEITGLLNQHHGLDLTLATLTNYMFRYGKQPQDTHATQNTILVQPVMQSTSIDESQSTNTQFLPEHELIQKSQTSRPEDSTLEKVVFGSPQHKAQIQSETEKYFTTPRGLSRFKKGDS